MEMIIIKRLNIVIIIKITARKASASSYYTRLFTFLFFPFFFFF